MIKVKQVNQYDYGNEERIKLRKDGTNRLDGMATG